MILVGSQVSKLRQRGVVVVTVEIQTCRGCKASVYVWRVSEMIVRAFGIVLFLFASIFLFRISVSAQQSSGLSQTVVEELVSPLKTPLSSFTLVKTWSAASAPAAHQTGHVTHDTDTKSAEVWECRPGLDTVGAGAFIYGPYLTFAPGKYAVIFRMKLLDAGGDDDVVTIDAVCNFAKTTLSMRPVSALELKKDRWVQVPLFIDYPGSPLECRVTWGGSSAIRVDSISIYSVKSPVLDTQLSRVDQPIATGKPSNLVPISEPRPFPMIFPRSAAPAERLTVIDLRKQSREWQYVTYSLQGLVNREKPRIYCLTSDEDELWLKWMIKRQWIKETRTVTTPDDLLQEYRSVVKGMVITDPALPPSKNIATMIAGVRDGIVVSPRLADLLKFPIIEDLRGRWSTSVNAYRWAFDTLWPKMNHHVIACSNPDQMALRDYLIENKVFIFWLSGPIDGARPYANAQGEVELMEQLLAKMPVNIPVMSYPYAGKDIGIGEGPGVTLFAEFGKYLVGTTDTSNLSVHSGIPINQLKQKPAPVTPVLDDSKVYVSYIMSDGDNLPVLSLFNFPSLWRDPLRGSFPIGWSASPSALMLMPDIVDYYYSTSSSNDLWVGAVSGIGYTYPDSYGLRFKASERNSVFDGFLQQTGDYMNRMDEKILWPMNLTHPEMIARYANKILGLEALFPDYGRRVAEYQDATYSTARNVPVFCAVTRWQEDAPDDEQIAGLVRDVRAMTPVTRPAFLHLFIWNWGAKIGVLDQVLKQLGPDYVAVRPDHLSSLFRSYMAREKAVLHVPTSLIIIEGKPALFKATLQNVSIAPLHIKSVTVNGLSNSRAQLSTTGIKPSEATDITIDGIPTSDQLSVHVQTTAGDRMATVKLRRIGAGELVPHDAFTGVKLRYVKHFPALTLSHKGGAQVHDVNALNGTAWEINPRNSTQGYVQFGPYEGLDAGEYVALFRLKRVKGGVGDVLSLDTCVGGGSPMTSSRKVTTEDLPEGLYKSFALPFNHPGGAFESRVLWAGHADIVLDSVTVWQIDKDRNVTQHLTKP